MTDMDDARRAAARGPRGADGQQVMLAARTIKTDEEIALLDHAAAIVDAVYEQIYELLRPGRHRARDRRRGPAPAVRARLRAGGGDQRRLRRPLQPAPARLLRPAAAPGRPGLLRHHPLVHGLPDVLLPHVLRRRREPGPARRLQAVPRVARRRDRPRPARRHHRPDRRRLADRAGARLPQRGGLLRPAVRSRPRRRPVRVADDLARCTRFDDPVEIEEGMVFALETYCAASDGLSAARIEEEVLVTADGTRILTRFPAEELLVAGAQYVRGADLVAERERAPGGRQVSPGRRGRRRPQAVKRAVRSRRGARALPPHAADPPLRGHGPVAVPAGRGARHHSPLLREEAVATGVCAVLVPQDRVAGTYGGTGTRWHSASSLRHCSTSCWVARPASAAAARDR